MAAADTEPVARRPPGVVVSHATQALQAGRARAAACHRGGQACPPLVTTADRRWLKVTYTDSPQMHVSHESIYRTLFVQSRSGLNKELIGYLRTGRAIRRPKGVRVPDGRMVEGADPTP